MISSELTTTVPARSPRTAAAMLLRAAASKEFAPEASDSVMTEVIASRNPTDLANSFDDKSGGMVLMWFCSNTVMPRSPLVRMRDLQSSLVARFVAMFLRLDSLRTVIPVAIDASLSFDLM
jgi:hypothetical protein